MFKLKSVNLLALLMVVAAPVFAADHGAPGASAEIFIARGQPVLKLSMSPPPDLVGQYGGIYIKITDDEGLSKFVGSGGVASSQQPIFTGNLPEVWEQQLDSRTMGRAAGGEALTRDGDVRCSVVTGSHSASQLNVEIGYAVKTNSGGPSNSAEASAFAAQQKAADEAHGRLMAGFDRLHAQLIKMGRTEEAGRLVARRASYNESRANHVATSSMGAAQSPGGLGRVELFDAATFTCS